jgi:iron complex transport system permease protein
VLLAVLLAASVVVAVTIGPAGLAPADVFASVLAHLGLGEPTLSPLRDGIVWELRMPRVLTAAAVGAGLAICGVVMQALTRNPLADPYLLGLSSGASVGAVLVLVLGIAVALPLAAFAGALAALAVTFGLARAAGGLSPTTTVLAGLAVSAVFGAVTSLVIFWSATNDSYREILNWLLGSLSGADWRRPRSRAARSSSSACRSSRRGARSTPSRSAMPRHPPWACTSRAPERCCSSRRRSSRARSSP